MGDSQEEEVYKEGALSNILMCPDCKENPPNLTEEFSSGDVVCTSCGVVVRVAPCSVLFCRYLPVTGR